MLCYLSTCHFLIRLRVILVIDATFFTNLSCLIHWFSDAAGFKAGDSVRLRMEIDDLSLEFFDQELTHNDIGYILERNEKEQVHTSAMTPKSWPLIY